MILVWNRVQVPIGRAGEGGISGGCDVFCLSGRCCPGGRKHRIPQLGWSPLQARVRVLFHVGAWLTNQAAIWKGWLVHCGRFVEGKRSPGTSMVHVGEGPSAVTVHFYGHPHPQVWWHSDDGSLFGSTGEDKLIVSLSLGSSARFHCHSRQSCSDTVGDSRVLGHGVVLVMGGPEQDEFRHCTSPGVERRRINLTFPWIKQHFHGCLSLCTVVACGSPSRAKGFMGSAGPWAVRLVAGQGGVNQVPVGNPPRPLRNWDARLQCCSLISQVGRWWRFTCAWTRPTGGGRSRYYFHHLRRRHQKRPIPPLAPPRRDPGSQQKGIFCFWNGMCWVVDGCTISTVIVHAQRDYPLLYF